MEPIEIDDVGELSFVIGDIRRDVLPWNALSDAGFKVIMVGDGAFLDSAPRSTAKREKVFLSTRPNIGKRPFGLAELREKYMSRMETPADIYSTAAVLKNNPQLLASGIVVVTTWLYESRPCVCEFYQDKESGRCAKIQCLDAAAAAAFRFDNPKTLFAGM